MAGDSQPSELLSLVLSAAREMSRYDDPADLTRVALEQKRKILHFDRCIAVTRRDVIAPGARIIRSDAPGTDFHDPVGYDEFPEINGGLLSNLLYMGLPRLIGDLNIATDHPGRRYLAG